MKKNIPAYGVSAGKQTLVKPFTFGYFQQKEIPKFYDDSRKLDFGPTFSPCCSFLEKQEFFCKIHFCITFFWSRFLSLHKMYEKIMNKFSGKLVTEEWTYTQAWIHRTTSAASSIIKDASERSLATQFKSISFKIKFVSFLKAITALPLIA